MDQTFYPYFSKEWPNVSEASVKAVLELHRDGGTVPFIARYRKEKTGNLDEVEIRGVLDMYEKFEEIQKRKAFLLKEIGGQGNLTDEIKRRIDVSMDLAELDEIYRPFKKKKKTKATLAREAGLGPLADWIWLLGHGGIKDTTGIDVKSKEYINPAAHIVTYELALKGAQDIVVDRIANEAALRALVRDNFFAKGKIICKKTKTFKANSKFSMYAEFSEAVSSIQNAKSSHRYLALRRGWQEGELTVAIQGEEDDLLRTYEAFAATGSSQVSEFLKECARLALTTHVHPSISNEVHRFLKDKADADAIKVFAENVRRVLLASPFGSRCVLGVDPGLRTGCKVALVDKSGQFISHTVMQILGESAHETAKKLFSEVLKQIRIEAIAVGNGTAGRETEAFLRKILVELNENVPVVMVNEAGASVYSASEVARQEFPDLDLTVRGAVSIARRLQDPLSELVKIEPKSIGVGQYQHDVSQTLLKKELHVVVEDSVNKVGVNLNTASTSLLSYVAGLGPALAQNIVEHRQTKGLFVERSDLLKVARFSSKAYEQAAGFLRIPDSKISLDATGVHPERYAAVKDMAAEIGVPVSQLIGEGAKKLVPLKAKWSPLVGEFTFDDIVRELEKPGLDPRDPFKLFSFRDDIHEVKDLKEGMICPGVVTNVTNFGAFVDIGVHQDGLVHISAMTSKFVDDPRKVVNPGDQVRVKVIGVDLEKNQIALSMKLEEKPKIDPLKQAEPRQPGPREDRRPRGGGRPDNRANSQTNSHADNRPDNRSDKRTDHRGPRREDQRPRFDAKNDNRDKSKQGAAPGRGDHRPPPPPRKPFNNSFGALAQLKGQLQKKTQN